MDLIYADKNKNDIGVIKDFQFDLAYGIDENNFELTLPISNHVCEEDYYIYIDGTEYGGIIDSVEVDTLNKTIKYKGRTFHGVLDKKIISPDSGSDYYSVSGDMNTILGTLISRLGLSNLFSASSETSSSISYTFNRYCTGYNGIQKMLTDNDYKLKMAFSNGMVELAAVPAIDYDDDSGLDSDRITFVIQQTYNVVNHLICLGFGELRNRTVVHLYVDQNGSIGTTQYYTGVDEITEVYDYPNTESVAELTSKGKEKLLSYNSNSIDVSLGEKYEFDIGDKITVTDMVTGVTVTRKITKKIVTINKDVLKISYSVGE